MQMTTIATCKRQPLSLPRFMPTSFEKSSDMGIKLEDWALCQIADNCTTNRKLTKLLTIFHVGCMSHKFQLDLSEIVKWDPELKGLLDYVSAVVDSAKGSLKNMALIRHFEPKHVLTKANQTRWSGNFHGLESYSESVDKLIQVADTGEATKKFADMLDCKPTHFAYAKKSTKMLGELNTVTQLVQRENDELNNSKKTVESLEERITAKANDPTHHMHKCPFVSIRCKPGEGTLSPDWLFEAAVCKVQEGLEQQLTEEESATLVRVLKREDSELESPTKKSKPNSPGSPGLIGKIRDEEKKRKAEEAGSLLSKHVNRKFVLSSAACIECVWSIAKYILCQQRHKMTPTMFECLLCLKVNRSFWNEAMVLQAYRNAKAKKRCERIQKLAQADLAEEEADDDVAEG